MTKAKNRMVFWKTEFTDDYTGEGYGLIGASGSGQLTIKPKNTQKLSKHLTKKTQERLKKEAVKKAVTASSKSGGVAGTASSIAFTPVQSIELVNPDAANAKLRDLNDKYFSSTGSFLKVGKSLPPLPVFGAPTAAGAGAGTGAGPVAGTAATAAAAAGMKAPPAKRQKLATPDTKLGTSAATATAYNEFSDMSNKRK